MYVYIYIAPKLLDFFAGPAITLSMAYSKSDLSTFECWTLAACNAASFTKFAKSAPRNERGKKICSHTVANNSYRF